MYTSPSQQLPKKQTHSSIKAKKHKYTTIEDEEAPVTKSAPGDIEPMAPKTIYHNKKQKLTKKFVKYPATALKYCRKITSTHIMLTNDLKNFSRASSLSMKMETACQTRNLLPVMFKAFKTLRSLNLSCMGIRAIEAEEMLRLSQAIRPLFRLQDLYLNFAECVNINSKGFSHLVHGFAWHQNCRSIELNFEKCKHVKDQGLQTLGYALKKKPKLKNLKANLSNCYEIRDQGLWYLA